MIPQLGYIRDDQMRKHVAEWFKISPDDITSDRRHAWRVQLRAALCYVLHYDYYWTQDRLATLVARDRSTVKHLLTTIEDAISTDNKQTNALLFQTTRCIRQLADKKQAIHSL